MRQDDWMVYCVTPGVGGVTRSKKASRESDIYTAVREALRLLHADVVLVVKTTKLRELDIAYERPTP